MNMRDRATFVYQNRYGAQSSVFRRVRGEIMDTGIIFALVLGTLFIGAIAWLVIYSNRQQPQRHVREISIEDTEPPSKKKGT